MLWNGLTITESETKNILFSNPYMETTKLSWCLAGSPIKVKPDLNGKVVRRGKTAAALAPGIEADAVSKSFKEMKK